MFNATSIGKTKKKARGQKKVERRGRTKCISEVGNASKNGQCVSKAKSATCDGEGKKNSRSLMEKCQENSRGGYGYHPTGGGKGKSGERTVCSCDNRADDREGQPTRGPVSPIISSRDVPVLHRELERVLNENAIREGEHTAMEKATIPRAQTNR